MEILGRYRRGAHDRAIVLHRQLVLDVAVRIEGTRAVHVAGAIYVVAELSRDEGRKQADAVVNAGCYLRRAGAGERQLCRNLTSADLADDRAVDLPPVATAA